MIETNFLINPQGTKLSSGFVVFDKPGVFDFILPNGVTAVAVTALGGAGSGIPSTDLSGGTTMVNVDGSTLTAIGGSSNAGPEGYATENQFGIVASFRGAKGKSVPGSGGSSAGSFTGPGKEGGEAFFDITKFKYPVPGSGAGTTFSGAGGSLFAASGDGYTEGNMNGGSGLFGSGGGVRFDVVNGQKIHRGLPGQAGFVPQVIKGYFSKIFTLSSPASGGGGLTMTENGEILAAGAGAPGAGGGASINALIGGDGGFMAGGGGSTDILGIPAIPGKGGNGAGGGSSAFSNHGSGSSAGFCAYFNNENSISPNIKAIVGKGAGNGGDGCVMIEWWI